MNGRRACGGGITRITPKTLKALEMAVARRCPDPGLRHHSGRGCTYTCDDYPFALDTTRSRTDASWGCRTGTGFETVSPGRHSTRSGPSPWSVPPILHLLTSEPRFRLERVVCPAAQLEIRGIRGAAVGERDDVMQFEEPALRAAPDCADERAPPPVSRPHVSLHGCRDVARPRRRPGGRPRLCRRRAPRPPRSFRGTPSDAFQVVLFFGHALFALSLQMSCQ